MKMSAVRVLLWALMCLALPVVGLWMWGVEVPKLWAFPPEVREIGEIGFSRWVAAVYWVGMLVLFAWLLKRRPVSLLPEASPEGGCFPGWGWCAVAWLGVGWWLAWSRHPWFSWGQEYTFTPLWVGYVVVVNAWVQKRTGRCPMCERPLFFFALFPVSAVFWWVFEYYNRFVHNWIYWGDDVGAVEYIVHASVCFSTVLPAVYSTAVLLRSFRRWQQRMRGPCWCPAAPRALACGVLLVCAASFLAVGVYPRLLYPLLWTGPLLVWLCLGVLAGRPVDLGNLGEGDWREVWTWALAALICGFFWEMWNVQSLVKWTYQVPHLHGVLVFEMPLAGFLGYLPFGLECALVVGVVRRAMKGFV